MAIARDALTKASAAFTTGTTISHTPVGTPKGVLVFITQNGSSTDEDGFVTYGSDALTKVAFAHDTANELMAAYAYFLGVGLATGTQNVGLSGFGASNKTAWVITLTAAADTEVEAFGIAEENQADPAVTLATGAGVETYIAALLASGVGSQGSITAGADGTKLDSHDWGQQVAVIGERNTLGTGGDVVFDWTVGADDVAMVAVAIKESGGGGGTALTKDLDDTVTLSDSISRVWEAQKAFADTVTPSDAIAKSIGLAKADSVTLSDAIAKAIGLSKADTVTVTDAFGRVWAVSRSVADTVTLSDAASKAVGLSKGDTATLSDAFDFDLSAGGTGLTLNLEDTVTLSDALAKSVGVYKSDTATLTDGLSKSIAVSKSDTVTLSDALSKALGLSKADSVTLADDIAKSIGLSKSDALSLSEALGKGAAVFFSDTVTITDDIDIVGGSHPLSAEFSDVIVLTDDIAIALNGVFQGGGGSGAKHIIIGRLGMSAPIWTSRR